MPHDGLRRTNFDQLEEGRLDVQLEQEPLLPGLPPRPRLLLGHHQPGHDAQHGHNDPGDAYMTLTLQVGLLPSVNNFAHFNLLASIC